MVNLPMELSDKDWNEVYTNAEVQAGFGVDLDTTLADFKSKVYAVKFDYVSDFVPVYMGDLIILMPTVFYKPMIMIRNKAGRLRVIEPGEA